MHKLQSTAQEIIKSLCADNCVLDDVRNSVSNMCEEFGSKSLLVLLQMMVYKMSNETSFERAFVAAVDHTLEEMYLSEEAGWLKQAEVVLSAYHNVAVVCEMDKSDKIERIKNFNLCAKEISKREGADAYHAYVDEFLQTERGKHLWSPPTSKIDDVVVSQIYNNT